MILLSLLFINQMRSAANQIPTLKNIACFDQVTRALDVVGTPTEWLRFPGGVASRIHNYGSIEIYPDNKNKTQFVLVGPKSTTGFILEAPKCKAKISFNRVNRPSFRDIDLAELMKKNKKGGAIYVWSPHMELSISEVANLNKYKMSIPVDVAVDAEADEKLLSKVSADKKLPEKYSRSVNSSVLFTADVSIHYPSTVFYKNGQILKRIPGYHGPNFNDIAKKILE